MPFTTTNLNARRNRPALAIKTHNISKPKLVYEPFLDYSDFGKDIRPLDQIPGAVPLKKAQPAVERRASVKRDEAKLKAAVLKAMESEPAACNAQFKDARRTAVLVQPKVKHQAMCAVVGVWEDQFPAQHQEMSAVVGIWEDQFPAKKPKSKVAKAPAPAPAPAPKPSPIPTVDSWLCGEFPSLYVNEEDVKTICEEVSPRSSTDTLVESVAAFEEKKPVPAPVVEAIVELPIPQPQRPALTLIPLNVAQARADIKYRPECFEAQPAPVKPKRGKSLRFWKKL